MLEWKIKNGDDKLRDEIKRVKEGFVDWFERCHASRTSLDIMLDVDKSPVKHVAYKMTKSFEEIKEKYSLDAQGRCSSCGKYIGEWIETEFSFCDEYGCGMSLCKDCAKDLKLKLEEFLK